MGRKIWLFMERALLPSKYNYLFSLHIIVGDVPFNLWFLKWTNIYLNYQPSKRCWGLLNHSILQNYFFPLISVSMNNLQSCAVCRWHMEIRMITFMQTMLFVACKLPPNDLEQEYSFILFSTKKSYLKSFPPTIQWNLFCVLPTLLPRWTILV